jgi:lipocalin
MRIYDQLSKRDKVIFHFSIWVFIIVFSYLFDENIDTAANTIVAFLMTGLFIVETIFVVRYFMKKSSSSKNDNKISYQNDSKHNANDTPKEYVDFSLYGDPEIVDGKWVRKFRYKREFKLPEDHNYDNVEYKLFYEINEDKVFFVANPNKENEIYIEVTDPEVSASIREFDVVEDVDIHIGFLNVNLINKTAKIKIAFYRSIDIDASEFVKKIEAKLIKTAKHDDGESRQDHLLDVNEGDYVILEEDDNASEGFVITNDRGYIIGELSKRDINKMDDYIDSWPCIIRVKEEITDGDNMSLLLEFNFVDPRAV